MSDRLNAKTWNLAKIQRYQLHEENDQIRLGLGSWMNIKYRGTIYDPKCAPEEFLKTYASQFDSVELGSTFHVIQSLEQVDDWVRDVREVNGNFRFCPKIPRVISHEQDITQNSQNLEYFISTVRGFKETLGTCVLQLPESFGVSSLAALRLFLKLWPSDLKLALEFRHQEWMEKHSPLVKLSQELQGSHVTFVVTDVLNAPQIAQHLHLTSDHVMIRFMARSKSQMDEQRLALWVYRLGEFKGYGVKNSYFFLHEQEEMCLGILKKMANSLGSNVKVPKEYDRNAGQMELGF
jgi:uncharacterized protein YecE (DUF72 family)